MIVIKVYRLIRDLTTVNLRKLTFFQGFCSLSYKTNFRIRMQSTIEFFHIHH